MICPMSTGSGKLSTLSTDAKISAGNVALKTSPESFLPKSASITPVFLQI